MANSTANNAAAVPDTSGDTPSGDTRVARVELYHFAAPLPATFHPSWLPGVPQNENRADLVRIVTRDGVEGWSAGAALGRERAGLGELLGPYLIGEDATDIPAIQQRLREMSYLGWRNWWIEPAFWDIRGKLAGLPVWRLLADEASGTAPDSVQVYASTGEVRSAADRVREVQQRYEEGFRAIKLRVHEDEASDIRQVREVCRAFSGRMTIGVDANQGWRVAAVADAPLWDLSRALRFAEVCAAEGVAWIEEPLAMDAYDDLAELSRRSQVPIAGGELHTAGYPELAMMARRGCYSIFQPDATFAGGISQSFDLARLCRELGLTYTPHTWTNGIGLAANLQVMAASGFAAETSLEYPYDPPAWTQESRDAMLEKPFVAEDGRLAVPRGPGLGFAVNRRALSKHGRRFFTMDRKRLVFFALRERGPRAAREIEASRQSRRQSGNAPG